MAERGFSMGIASDPFYNLSAVIGIKGDFGVGHPFCVFVIDIDPVT